jgi:hypothetical protein
MNTTTRNNGPRCDIDELHCENCGSTAPEDVAFLNDTDGYTRCCNECTSSGPTTCRAHHVEEDR